MAAGNSVLAGLAKSKVKARAALKGMSSSEVEKLISNFSAVLETEIKKEQARAEAAKNAKIAKIRALMEESGLDAADLKGTAKRRGRKKAAVKSKAKSTAKAAAKKRTLCKTLCLTNHPVSVELDAFCYVCKRKTSVC